jgi:hypothetical protein
VKRPKLALADLSLCSSLYGVWSDCHSAPIVKPETVITGHRKGLRLFWTWKVRHGQPGRPALTQEVKNLIRRMSRETHSGVPGFMVNFSISIVISTNYINPD